MAAAVLLALFVRPTDSTVGESTDLLPPTTPIHIALNELSKHFGGNAALSTVAVVFERTDSPLAPDDLAQIEDLAQLIAHPKDGDISAAELSQVSILTPASLAITAGANPLISADGHAAIISLSLPFNYVTKQAARVARHVQNVVLAYPLPPGLSVAVTGSAGFGYDYGVATQRSHQKTLIVTLISVIVILLVVYRAPCAALIPLAGISVAAVIALKILTLGETVGVHSGTAEEIFTFVLLYGGGIDYSLLFMSRYREFLSDGKNHIDSITHALDSSLSAIASSAVMTVSGLAMLCFARFSIFRHAGPAVMLALIIAAFAAATLVPALLAIIGPRAFWPAKLSKVSHDAALHRWRVWPAIAKFVVERPRVILIVTVGLLIFPAIQGLSIPWSYDSLTSLKANYQAARGLEMAERHWPVGETAPVTVLAVASRPLSFDEWAELCDRLVASIRAIPDVGNIRSIVAPLGFRASSAENATVSILGREKITSQYISPGSRAMRLSIVLTVPPLSNAALADVGKISSAAQSAATSAHFDANIFLTGASAEMIDIARITHEDFDRIVALSLIVILIVVSITLRDLPLAIFILAATALSYLTTLGLTLWVFQALGADELEWKVQLMLYIVLVAVGQDYSIFFALRYEQEARSLPRKEAIQRALIFTGPVISSCGLIMAATLGSIMAGDIKLLVQLGFAFALGMLVDTFIVRPLMLPAFILLTGRVVNTSRKNKAHAEAQSPQS